MSSKNGGPSTPILRRDPYEVLSVTRDSTDQEIKTAYRKLALKLVLFLSILLVYPFQVSVIQFELSAFFFLLENFF